eukprot:5692208-Ditylum_brightwellii.AAC.1
MDSVNWACLNKSYLWTTTKGGTTSYGNIFEVFAPNREDQKALIIKNFRLLLQSPGVDVRALVYTKLGTYKGFELDASAWTLICDTTMMSNLFQEFMKMLDRDCDDIHIVGPERYFYVTFKKSTLLYTQGKCGYEVTTPV